jgi:5-methylcytosine-specific restriction endonuclease McrA
VRAKTQRRRAVLAGLESTLTAEQWLSTLEYFGQACAYCLRTDVPLEMDHIIPVSKGGGTTQENVIPACREHNARKYNHGILRALSW